jgi:hypothetical protein
MAFEFQAALIVPDLKQIGLSFADHPTHQRHYLILQRDQLPVGKAASSCGLVYVERDDQQFGGYGGIESMTLTRRSLKLAVIPSMAKLMGNHDTLTITFVVDDGTFHQIDETISRIFEGYEDRVMRS